jgi:hypothetical protein
MITDVTGISPQREDMPVGYLGQAAFRREQCDIMAESRKSENE